MKPKLFIPLLAMAGACLAQDERPAPDAFDPAVSGPLLIQVQVELIDLSHAKVTELLFDRSPTGNATALRKEVQELVKKGEAEVAETMICVTRPGQQAASASAREHIYPTEYEPAEIPNNVEVDFGTDPEAAKDLSQLVTPATPTAFEMRNVGTNLEVHPTLEPDGEMISLKLAGEVVKHTGQSTWQKMKDTLGNENEIVMPLFYSVRLSTELACRDGLYVFGGLLTPKGEDGEANFGRKLMVFAKCDVIPAKL